MTKIPAAKPNDKQIQRFRELADKFIARTGYKPQFIAGVEFFLSQKPFGEMTFGDMEKAIGTMESMLSPDIIEQHREIAKKCASGEIPEAKKVDGVWMLQTQG